MPYRISARAERTPERVAPGLALALRVLGALFAFAALASLTALVLVGGRHVSTAVLFGNGAERTFVFVVPLALAFVASRAGKNGRLRLAASASAVAWVVALALSAIAGGIAVTAWRSLALAGAIGTALVAARDRVVARWPALAAIALVVADAAHRLDAAPGSRVFEPSPVTVAELALAALALFASARAIEREGIEAIAARVPAGANALFADDSGRLAFRGPARWINDVLAAFAIATVAESTSVYAYADSFRVTAPSAGPEIVLVVLALAVALYRWRAIGGVRAPFVLALAAALVAGFSAFERSSVANAVVGILVAAGATLFVRSAPEADRGADRTKRSWTSSTNAAAILVGSAGLLTAFAGGIGEPPLVRLVKVGAVVAAIAAARAGAKLELGARVELAAEPREP